MVYCQATLLFFVIIYMMIKNIGGNTSTLSFICYVAIYISLCFKADNLQGSSRHRVKTCCPLEFLLLFVIINKALSRIIYLT
ncbi:hypothetical protein BDA99DRAFT_507566 [Phascolomyces articulosus]|uniref:Uncharacterized protein n=1 Tax=Phascolomyces articulosus TaxID=60185 RepID=A0AAD5PF58_9FUNG|nr:hypothetical protein BDA99DRAFT_507566 [Phascolomyces articulosus]